MYKSKHLALTMKANFGLVPVPLVLSAIFYVDSSLSPFFFSSA